MATVLQNSLYKDRESVDSLSKNFESHVLHSPQYADRITISQELYDQYLSRSDSPPKAPWGRSLSYGGFGPVQLPKEHRPKQEPPITVQKGHRHFGGGVLPFPRGLPIEQYYDLTLLKKSNLRRNDELVPSPETLDMGKIQIPLPFPSEHPYYSQVPKFAVFPSVDSPDDVRKGREAIRFQSTLPPTAPASAPDPTILEKTKGSVNRRELVKVQTESDKKPLTWLGPNFHQLVKGPDVERQNFYPTPPSSVWPNATDRTPQLTVSPRTANALYNLQRCYWHTHYNQQYAGNGPQNVLKLDNFDEVCRGSGETLKEHLKNKFTQPRPLEGRHSSVRNNCKQKTDHVTEPCVTDSEEDDEEENPRNKHHIGGEALHEQATMTGRGFICQPERPSEAQGKKKKKREWKAKWSEGYLQVSPLAGGTYSSAQLYGLADRSYLPSHVTSYHVTTDRPATAPEQWPRPRSPIIHNMPSQLPEKSMTGSTNNDLYPKWFRPVAKYDRARPSTALIRLQDSWSKTNAQRKFHQQFFEDAPDIRRKPDLRITTNERRHVNPETGLHVYYFHR